MHTKTIAISAIGLAVVVAGVLVVNRAVSGTSSTTALDSHSTTTTASGARALSGNIVAGRIDSKYHPLPWVGSDVSNFSCPALPAVAGSTITCQATSDGKKISIPVRVLSVGSSSVTWSFDR